MKISIKLSIVLSCLFIGSCQTDINELNQKPDSNITSQSDIERRQESVPYGTQFFERRLQWVAYLSAKVILHNKNARAEVLSLSSDNKIDINALILPESQAVHFKSAFMEELNHYFWSNGEVSRGPDEDTPPSGISPCCVGPNGYPTLSAAQFMDFMTIDNCIELYFPIPLTEENTSDPELIASTGHPLSVLNKNYGYIRYIEPILNEEDVLTYTQLKIIDSNFLESKIITVVARPFRKSKSCLYEDYNYISSFETFLNNN